MVTKIKILIAGLVVVTIAILVFFQFTENQFLWLTFQRKVSLNYQAYVATNKRSCVGSQTISNCFEKLMSSLGGVQTSEDFKILHRLADQVCEQKSACTFLLVDVLINSMEIENYLIAKKFLTTDSHFKKILNREINATNAALREYRKQLVDNFDQEVRTESSNTLNYLKLVDSVIVKLQKEKK